ncbi:pah, partial [Symbiodinium sp. KB8]
DVQEFDPLSFIIVEAKHDKPGVLGEIMQPRRHLRSNDSNPLRNGMQDINLTHIESRLKSFTRDGPSFHIDFQGPVEEPKIQRLMKEIKVLSGVYSVEAMAPREALGFPLNIRDLDLTVDTLDGGSALINEDHPGFSDAEYRDRRDRIVQLAKAYRHGDRLPFIEYTDKEISTWQAVYERLQDCHAKWACTEYREMLQQMEKYCGYRANNIPQLADISDFLQQRTGFTLRPISGLLSARDFLNALAFRVFYSTQYIRHHGNPFYTPEPDVCHELLGHVPLFANPAFADFSQEIGLASLAASDDDVTRLASVYWFTVELSSFGEMEWACDADPSEECREMGSMKELAKPTVLSLDPVQAAKQEYPITTYQPVLFCADSLQDAKTKISHFCDSLTRPFFPQYAT